MPIDRALLQSIVTATSFVLVIAWSTGLAGDDALDGCSTVATYGIRLDVEKKGFGREGDTKIIRISSDRSRLIENYLATGKPILVNEDLGLDPPLLDLVSGALSYLETLPLVTEGDSKYPISTSEIVRYSESILVSEFEGELSVLFKSSSFTLVVYFSSIQDQFAYRYIVH